MNRSGRDDDRRGAVERVIMDHGIGNQSMQSHSPAWRAAIAPLKSWFQSHLELAVMASAFAAMTLAYIVVFQIAREEGLFTSISAGLRNIGAILPIAVFVRFCVRGPLRQLPFPSKVLAHIVLACFVSLAWYTLVLFLRNWSFDWMQSGLELTPFSEKASFWHLYQGLVVYAAIVAASYAFLLRSEIAALQQKPASSAPYQTTQTGSLFVKSGDEIIRLAHQDVTHISANNETVFVHTRQRRFRSRRKIRDLERHLHAFGFVRLHRSHLINIAMVQSAEPTGDGRLTVHMINNTSLVSSRAGARRFRECVSV